LLELEAKKGKKLVWMNNPHEINIEEPKPFHELFKIFCVDSFYTCSEVVVAL